MATETQFGKLVSCKRISHNLWKVFIKNDKKLDDFVIESHYDILPCSEILRKWIKGVYYIKNFWGGCDGYCFTYECHNCKSEIMANGEEPFELCKCGGKEMMDILAIKNKT